MRHEKEWYTCDRCESEIKMMPKRRTFLTRKVITSTEFNMRFANVTGYVADTELVSPSLTGVQIKEICDVGYKEFHLCPKCRKDFERFMKNENNGNE